MIIALAFWCVTFRTAGSQYKQCSGVFEVTKADDDLIKNGGEVSSTGKTYVKLDQNDKPEILFVSRNLLSFFSLNYEKIMIS